MKRYIDDIFIIWPKHQDFNAFFKSLNSFHPNIKFTTSQSENSINFLDLNIYKGSSFQKEKKLDVSMYQKTNNLYKYLHFYSNHPNHVKNGLIIGEAIRYVRTNSTQCEYLKQIGKFTQRLMSRGYPKRFIEKALKKVDYQRRPCYLQQNISPPKVHIFHRPIFECIPPPRFQYLKNIILHGLKQLDMDLHPLFVTKKHVTIKDVIVKARHSPTEADSMKINAQCKPIDYQWMLAVPKERVVKTPKPCGLPRCATCNHYKASAHFTSSVTKKCYRIRYPFSCDTKNAVYLITCRKCSKQYVGKTCLTLRSRINQHRSSIKMKRERYISKHFNLPAHSITDFSVQIIDTSSDNTKDLSQLEKYWINILQTIQPKGLNVAFE